MLKGEIEWEEERKEGEGEMQNIQAAKPSREPQEDREAV
jgi:hypothetical protein